MSSMSYEYNPTSLGLKAISTLPKAKQPPAADFAPPYQQIPPLANSSPVSSALPTGPHTYPAAAGHFTETFYHGSPGSPAVKPPTTSLAKMMDQVSPPNVVIGTPPAVGGAILGQHPAAAPPAEAIPRPIAPVGLDYMAGSKYRSLLGGSSSPEPEETRQEGKSEAPPNRTISYEDNQWTSWENVVKRNLLPQPRNAPTLYSPPQAVVPEHQGLQAVAGQWDNFKQHQQQPPVGFNAAEIKRFTETFQFARIKAGFSYSDVVGALASLYGTDLDEFTLRKFEELNLPVSQAIRLKPCLERWMNSLSYSSAHNNRPIEISSRTSSDSETEQQKKPFYGRKRTKIDSKSKVYMESYFKHSQKPNYEELIAISSNTGLDRDVVRVWFSNRRQKERRQRDSQGAASPTAGKSAVLTAGLATGVAAVPTALGVAFSTAAPTAFGRNESTVGGTAEPEAVGQGTHASHTAASSPNHHSLLENWLLSHSSPYQMPFHPAGYLGHAEGSSSVNRSCQEKKEEAGTHFPAFSPCNTPAPAAGAPLESSWSTAPTPSLEHACCSKTSVIVSRKDQQQKVTAVKEPARSFEHTFLMTPRAEESADRSDDDWSGCY